MKKTYNYAKFLFIRVIKTDVQSGCRSPTGEAKVFPLCYARIIILSLGTIATNS